ncbi:MAG: aminopeptidase N [Gammaproteobacteria bacterium]
MLNPNPTLVRLEDYRPPAFTITTVDLDVDIQAESTVVTARLALVRNPAAADPEAPLDLDGEALTLLEIALDGRVLSPGEFAYEGGRLVLPQVPDRFTLMTRVRIHPERNTQLMGLYASRNGYFTQCEAEGFRRITFYLDRPDVMARFTTTLHADHARFPVLLSNGNLVAAGDEADGRHWARWEDPFPKPAYLFALVAARLDLLADQYRTRSGRDVRLCVYVEPGRLDQCTFAVAALKAAMRWDEDVFGLEVDLDQYMIVAVSDFNMGAMENKGLNIFNTKYVLARPDLATDYDFMMLDRVVAHEYFHNWTGNRVTCRDWFQLSLKEGLTVFRDQQYGGDRYSHAVQRIQEVRNLRNAQFPEDAGPMAHPVRPRAYMEISNFYTATVYNKGAEVVRIMHTWLGAAGFRRGMDLYFARHDGQAVCTEDFVRAMQEANGVDLAAMQRWYDQAGTPRVTVTARHDPHTREYHLTFTQQLTPVGGQTCIEPFPIPIRLGLLDRAGHELPLVSDDPAMLAADGAVYLLAEATRTLVLKDLPTAPIPSLLRGFSAPVILQFAYSEDDLALLMAHDTDPFNRWEAGQRLALASLLRGIEAIMRDNTPPVADAFIAACRRVLADADRDPAFAAEALALPAATFIAEQMDVVDPDAILAARNALRRDLATRLRPELHAAYDAFRVAGPFAPSPEAAGRRALRNVCLGYLMELGDPALEALCFRQFETADNMTDTLAALTALVNTDCAQRQPALAAFHARWCDEPLVLDKWFTVQATSRLPGTLKEVEALLVHPSFELSNPNKVRALIGAFCQGNHAAFHAADGGGYRFAATQVIALDPLNPQVAARLARAFDRWRKFDAGRQAHARAALESIRATPGLSKDTTEVVTRALE